MYLIYIYIIQHSNHPQKSMVIHHFSRYPVFKNHPKSHRLPALGNSQVPATATSSTRPRSHRPRWFPGDGSWSQLTGLNMYIYIINYIYMYIYTHDLSIDLSIYLSIRICTLCMHIYMVAHPPKKRRACFNCVLYMYNMCNVFDRIIPIYMCVCGCVQYVYRYVHIYIE